MHKPNRRLIFVPAVFFALSVVLFLGSLANPAFRMDRGEHRDAIGFGLLLIGWLGVLEGILAWLANPALLVTWVLIWYRRGRPLGILSGLAGIGFALTFLRQKTFDLDEAGNQANIIAHGAGYWMWIASIATATLGCVFAILNDWVVRRRDYVDSQQVARNSGIESLS